MPPNSSTRTLYQNTIARLRRLGKRNFQVIGMYSCFIIPDEKKQHNPIFLEHQKPVVIGRGPSTKIKDPRLSRNHLELTADCQVATLTFKLIGENRCQAANHILRKGQSVILKNEDCFQLLENQYPFKVCFQLKSAEEEMVGKQTTLNFYIKRKSDDDGGNTSKKAKTSESWQVCDDGGLIIFTTDGVESRSKVAAFDMDGTIITTKSGNVFPKNAEDWKMLYDKIPAKLKELHKDGYRIVFLTNQAGLKTDAKLGEFRKKLAAVCAKLGVPVQVFISPKRGMYRKPAPGMWQFLVNLQANDGVSVDVASSFYCGDAAGREANWAPGKKKDHSSADRLLAHNLGLSFYTPEEYFLAQRPALYKEPEFQPKTLEESGSLLDPTDAALASTSQEVITLVGFPGSGKSHFSAHHSDTSGYRVINRDTLGTWQKCAAAIQTELQHGHSLIIDNTNLDLESRQRIVALAAARRIPVRCFVMNTTLMHARHNNRFRELTDTKHQPIDGKVFVILKSKYVAPELSEGFTEIVRVNFVPRFKIAAHEELYRMFLLES